LLCARICATLGCDCHAPGESGSGTQGDNEERSSRAALSLGAAIKFRFVAKLHAGTV